MKKTILLFIIVLFIFTQIIAGAGSKLLKMEVPPGKAKNRIWVNLDDLQKILDDFKVTGITANIKLTDLMGNTLVILGKIKKGKIKWGHKVVDEKSLNVKFKKDNYSIVLSKVKKKSRNPGFQIQVIEVEFDLMSTRGKIAQSFEKSGKFNEKAGSMRTCDITFVEQVDLAVQMEYPIEVLPGEEMGDRISVHIENKGNAPVGGFNVELVLSEDDQIPVKPAVYSETFVEDALLKDAMETVAGLKPGESITLKLKASVKVPPDTPPGRYYLGAVIDPENKIEEATEENNTFARFIMISYPQPKRVVLEMPDTHLIYDPANFGVKIVSGGVTFSDGKDWRKCRIRPYIHQLKHVGWENCHWELNTVDRSVWKVKDGKFCKIGGLGEEVKMKMEVRGGSKTNIPSQVVLRLKDTCLDYEPSSGKLKLMSYKHQCAYIPFWKVARIKSHLYQFRHALWDFFWEVNTFKKQAHLVNGGKFGTQGGTPTPLNINVTVED